MRIELSQSGTAPLRLHSGTGTGTGPSDQPTQFMWPMHVRARHAVSATRSRGEGVQTWRYRRKAGIKEGQEGCGCWECESSLSRSAGCASHPRCRDRRSRRLPLLPQFLLSFYSATSSRLRRPFAARRTSPRSVEWSDGHEPASQSSRCSRSRRRWSRNSSQRALRRCRRARSTRRRLARRWRTRREGEVRAASL